MIPALMPTYNRAPLSFVSGEGSWLTEADGRRFLDFAAGIGVNALGHAHPALVRALTGQAGRLWHVSNLYRIPEQEALAERLIAASFADTVFFTNSGTEATELALKMIRRFWHGEGRERHRILTFSGAFHGRSTGAIAAAGPGKMTDGFGPLMPGFEVLEWGDHDALRAAMDDTVAAVMVEPIQGEGGIRTMPPECLRGLRELCDATGALMVLDEVQCGTGRTGRLFAHEWAGIAPDILLVAKGIGGGFPLGAVLAQERAAAPMVAGTHGSTYGGNPLGCAVGAQVMEIVAEPDFLAEVERKGAAMEEQLSALVAAHPAIFAGVRGKGLMRGLACKVTNTDVVAAARDAELLVVPAADNVVRLLPPLIISDDEIADGLARLDRAASALAAQDAPA